MNELMIFDNPDFGQMRTFEENGNIFVCGSDVARALGYEQPHKAIERHCKKDGGMFRTVTDNLGREQRAKFINEGNLYRLVINSKLPTAEKFERWIFDEVLPIIRKTGAYLTPDKIEEALLNPDTIIGLATQIKTLQLETKQQQQIIGELKPKATYYDIILNNKGLVTITQIAKDYGMSGQAMNDKLHELGVQYKQSSQWLLYVKYQDKGYTHSETVTIKHKDGTDGVKMNTKWTQKGRLFLYDLLRANEIFPVIEQEMSA